MFKFYLSILITLIAFTNYSQNISAFSDVNNKLYQFNKGEIKLVEYQKVSRLQIGNKYIAYANSQGDYYVRWEDKKMRLAQGFTEFFETDNMLIAHFTSILKVVDKGKIINLTSFVQSFGYGDSLVVFQDKIGGNLKYYYQDTIIEFAQIIGEYEFYPGLVGNNVFAYADNAGNYYAFQNHHFYPLFSANGYAKFSAGLNVIAFNDLENSTFAMYRNGEIFDLEDQYALNYKAGDDFVYYKDQSETHKVYYDDEIYELGFYLQNISVRDSVVTFFEAGYLKIWYDKEIYTIYNTNVSTHQIDGGIVAFTNKNGGVSAFVRGEEIEITNQKVTGFWLNGNTIVLQFSPSSFAVWWSGKLYRF